jgi:hypothetical protein
MRPPWVLFFAATNTILKVCSVKNIWRGFSDPSELSWLCI